MLAVLVESVEHLLGFFKFTVSFIIVFLSVEAWIICVKILGLSKDILFATNPVGDIFGVIVSKRPVDVVLFNVLQLSDAGFEVGKGLVRELFVFFGEIGVHIVHFIFIRHPLKEAALRR